MDKNEEIIRIIKLPNSVTMNDAIYVITQYIYELKQEDVKIVPRPYENQAVAEAYNIAKSYYMKKYNMLTLQLEDKIMFIN